MAVQIVLYIVLNHVILPVRSRLPLTPSDVVLPVVMLMFCIVAYLLPLKQIGAHSLCDCSYSCFCTGILNHTNLVRLCNVYRHYGFHTAWWQNPEHHSMKFCNVYINSPLSFPQTLTHCGRVTEISVFNTVKLGTSASSP